MPTQAEELLRAITNVIPEGYVDLIRRIVPGATVLLTLCFLTGIPQARAIGSFTFWGFAAFLLLSYVVGFALDSFMELATSKCSRRHAWRLFSSDSKVIETIAEAFCMTVPELKQKRYEILGSIRLRVMKEDHRAAILLPKLVAEEFFFKNLALGILLMSFLFVSMVLGWVQFSSSPDIVKNEPWFVGTSLAVSELLVVVGAFRRTHRTVVRTLEWFREVYEKELAALKQKESQNPPGSERV